MPKGSSPRRAQAIRDAGQTEVTITQWNYDDTVNYVNQCAEKNDWVLVQDTSWGGYEQVPKWIMQGYTTMAQEAAEQLTEMPTHIFLQAGVGAMAGAVTGYYRARYGENCPKIVLVEPYGAACIYESMEADDGQPHTAKGNGETIMAGLNCGSPALWLGIFSGIMAAMLWNAETMRRNWECAPFAASASYLENPAHRALVHFWSWQGRRSRKPSWASARMPKSCFSAPRETPIPNPMKQSPQALQLPERK